jgi:U3 small nucleolar RNA-associated protein 22
VSLRSLVLSLPPVGPENPIVASRSLLTGGVAVPYPNPLPTEETNWKVAFEAPVDVKVVGSWANKCAVLAKDKGGFTVDLAFEMPSVR